MLRIVPTVVAKSWLSQPRLQSFAFKRGLRILPALTFTLIACALLLVGAGILEGYVSPDPRVPPWARGAIGAGYWLFMVALLSGWLFGRRARPAAAFKP